jgi:hypothetical protein
MHSDQIRLGKQADREMSIAQFLKAHDELPYNLSFISELATALRDTSVI